MSLTQQRCWDGHRGRILDAVDTFDVIACETCGFKHVVPLPAPDELEAFYRGPFYAVEKPLYLERAREDLSWWNLAYADRYDTFEELLPPDSRHILDVGSGPGFFLLHGKQRGWDVVGLEPSQQATDHARRLGLDIRQAVLDEATAETLGRFNVVHASEVLEHVPDPAGILRLAHRLLLPHGLLCVEVPNDYSPFQETLRQTRGFAPWWVAPPQHLNYFDGASLECLVRRCGFEPVMCEATFPIDMFLLMGLNYVGNDQLGRQCHSWRKMLELTLAGSGLTDLKRRLYRALAELRIGREIVLVARRKETATTPVDSIQRSNHDRLERL